MNEPLAMLALVIAELRAQVASLSQENAVLRERLATDMSGADVADR